jgi:AbrB family looped-hinge helix DNA binding protein
MENSAVISSKGQLVIPAKLRKEFGWKAGVRVVFKKQGTGLLIESGSYEAVLALRGKYAGLPLEADLAESRRLDEQKGEKKLEALYKGLRP